VPQEEGGEVEKVMRKVQRLSNEVRLQNDAGMRGPSSHAGMARHGNY
jgi:hypothetical protein